MKANLLVLLEKNGTGKSTILNLLAGLTKPTKRKSFYR